MFENKLWFIILKYNVRYKKNTNKNNLQWQMIWYIKCIIPQILNKTSKYYVMNIQLIKNSNSTQIASLRYNLYLHMFYTMTIPCQDTQLNDIDIIGLILRKCHTMHRAFNGHDII